MVGWSGFPPGHDEALLDESSIHFMGSLAHGVVARCEMQPIEDKFWRFYVLTV
jgi:hypothetical protein